MNPLLFIKRVKKKLKNEFREGEDYKICRFDIFKLVREEAEFYLRKKKGYLYEELKEKFKDYTRQFLLLYDWDVPEGGAGGNPSNFSFFPDQISSNKGHNRPTF